MRPVLALAAVVLWASAHPAAGCSAYSCEGVGWHDYDPERPGPTAAFQAARREGTPEALDRFVRAYPGSPAASEALALREELSREAEAREKGGASGGR
ncbi:hypothetical protein [Lutibaculum baratangense]|uniref:Uncharacterized protein n=1 Tax=Lutibaculum baratangense AMV1 TaxID=631454 RepID=V4RQ33_9HYPH|nr:hypothetical protein [Lutibaculum baratangense]ESR25295.1 hypothetical protein N177_1812 [Lutibaculum baratangense AMV1]